MTALPGYSGPECDCAKCGSNGADTTYFRQNARPDTERLAVDGAPLYAEFMLRECTVCGYRWAEAPLNLVPVLPVAEAPKVGPVVHPGRCTSQSGGDLCELKASHAGSLHIYGSRTWTDGNHEGRCTSRNLGDRCEKPVHSPIVPHSYGDRTWWATGGPIGDAS